MTRNKRLLALIEKYNQLKVGHKYALCKAAVANQNNCFNETAKLLLDTTSASDAKAIKNYIDRHMAH